MTSDKPSFRPLIVGLGGTTRANSTSERVLVRALAAAESLGAQTQMFGGVQLSQLPVYDPATADSSPQLKALLDGVRQADGLIICTPAYHGSVSGVIKNALDALEGLRSDARPYLDGRAVGCIVTADGGQAGGTTLSTLRSVIHALRGWPTPLGVSFNVGAGPLFDDAGQFNQARDTDLIGLLVSQVVTFARAQAALQS